MVGLTTSSPSTSPLSSKIPANSGLEGVYLKGSFDVDTSLNGSLEIRPNGPSAEVIKEIQQTITRFLERCNIPFHVTQYDLQLHNACVEEAVRRGYPLDTPNARGNTLRRFFPQGIVMAMATYAHLKNQATRIYIALYTALLIYLDDVFKDDIQIVAGFNENFIQRRPQGDPVLDALADVLRETSQHFAPIVSNLIITSSLNFITAIPLEHESLNIDLSPHAHEFPPFIRIVSGAGEAYTLFAFPPEVPLHTYMHAIPDIRNFLNGGNDALSFYKEEIAGETVNQISILAQCQQVSKIEILRRTADSAADSHIRALRILARHPAALETYLQFSHGNIGFHTSLKRYKLGELYNY